MTRRGVILAACLGVAAASPAFAQREGYVVRRPVPPPTEVLDRLNLKMRWLTYLPVRDIADGPAIVQVLGGQVFAQLRSGVLIAIDARTGGTQWFFRFPQREANVYPVAINPNTVFVVHGTRLYALDRTTGFKVFEQPLSSTPSTGPVCDLERVYVTLANNRIVVYSHAALILPTPPPPPPLPDPLPPQISLEPTPPGPIDASNNPTPSITMLQSLQPPYRIHGIDSVPSIGILPTLRPPYRLEGNRTPSITIVPSLAYLAEQSDIYIRDKLPTRLFEIQVNRGIDYVPLVGKELLAVATNQQLVLGLSKTQNQEVFAFPTGSAVTAPMGQYLDIAYVPTADSNLFALNLDSTRPDWRFTGGGAMDRKPFVTTDSVYVAGDRSGITRVHRQLGERIWYHPTADRILAMNPKFIYATDRSGRLHVIDRARGLGLSSIDVHEFGPPVVNEEDDRLFLTGHNGLLVCMQDRDYPTPVPTLTLPRREPPPKKEPEPEPKKEEPAPEPRKPPEPKKAVEKEPPAKKELKKELKKEAAPKEMEKDAEPKKEMEKAPEPKAKKG